MREVDFLIKLPDPTITDEPLKIEFEKKFHESNVLNKNKG